MPHTHGDTVQRTWGFWKCGLRCVRAWSVACKGLVPGLPAACPGMARRRYRVVSQQTMHVGEAGVARCMLLATLVCFRVLRYDCWTVVCCVGPQGVWLSPWLCPVRALQGDRGEGDKRRRWPSWWRAACWVQLVSSQFVSSGWRVTLPDSSTSVNSGGWPLLLKWSDAAACGV